MYYKRWSEMNSFVFLFLLNTADCGIDILIENGIANFTNAGTTYGQFAPIICNEGYELTAGTHTECLSDGTWSTTSTFQPIGMFWLFSEL